MLDALFAKVFAVRSFRFEIFMNFKLNWLISAHAKIMSAQCIPSGRMAFEMRFNLPWLFPCTHIFEHFSVLVLERELLPWRRQR